MGLSEFIIGLLIENIYMYESVCRMESVPTLYMCSNELLCFLFCKHLQISALDPDLCITAAYGHFLPASFLRLPRYGTLNIHPSLLPKYRGAAPVQRSLEQGDKVVGVSVLYSVREMDAGPLVAQVPLTLKVGR